MPMTTSKAPLRRAIAAASIAAALLGAPVARADGADPITATQVQKYQAQQLLLRGRQLTTQKKFAEAAVELRASLNIVASPNTRFALARCLVEMGALVDAYNELTKTIADARALAAKEARYGEAADAAETERKDLAQKIVVLTLKIDHMAADTVVKINDKEVPKDALAAPIPLVPGVIDIVVTTGGKEASRNSSAIGPGETTVSLDAEPPKAAPPPPPPRSPTAIDPNDIPKDDPKPKPPPPPPAPSTGLRTGAYIAGGVGVLGLIGFGVFGALEKGTYSDLQTACHNGPCPANKQDDVSSGKTQQLLANVGLVVGVVGVAAGATLFVLSMPKKTAGPVSAQVVVGPSFIGVRGAL